MELTSSVFFLARVLLKMKT